MNHQNVEIQTNFRDKTAEFGRDLYKFDKIFLKLPMNSV